MSKNNFSESPSKTEHLSRQKYNYCPSGNLYSLDGEMHRFVNFMTVYRYVDAQCNCWSLLPVAQSVFHKPWVNYKLVHVNEDCSSMEGEVPRSGLKKDCHMDTTGQQGGSFNFFD